MDEVVRQLRRARRVTVLTAAGMSVESGLPTFRGASALAPVVDRNGQAHRFEELASPRGFARDPELVWSWYNARVRAYRGAEPNAGHRALAEMEKLFERMTIATQNVDSLHQRAGSGDVIELHGHLRDARCTRCEAVRPIPLGLDVPIAHECGGMYRPSVVWFGEALPADAWRRATEAAMEVDVVLVVGTSAVVYPAASLAFLNERAFVVEINPDETPACDTAAVSIREPAGAALPRIVRALAVGR